MRAARSSLLVLALLAPSVWSWPTAAADPATVGYRDQSYAASGVSAPTGQKPQSKLWFHGGSWWGALFSVAQDAYTIHRLDWASQTWTDLGVVIDVRNAARVDVLSVDDRIYTASHGANPANSSHDLELRRFDYDTATSSYTPATGFPVTLADGGMDAAVIDIDGTGTLWATWIANTEVLVTHSGANDTSWVAPYVLPVAGANDVAPDDISAVVDTDTGIGVLWSNDVRDAFYFAEHTDGAPDTEWTASPAAQGPEYADDHINLASLRSDPAGRVFAVVKTSLDPPDAPLLVLLIQDGTGGWQRRTVTTKEYEPTRAIVVLDSSNRIVSVFAAAPCCGGGVVYGKHSSLDRIDFPGGLGTPAIQSSTDTSINNVTSTKQNVTAESGLVVLASDDHSKRYLHNAYELGSLDTDPPETSITSGPDGTVSTAGAAFSFTADEPATFRCALDAAPPEACTSPVSYSGLADGSHTVTVTATDDAGNVDPTPATRSWTVDLSGATTYAFTADADATLDESAPTQTFGAEDRLIVDGGSSDQVALVRFDVAGLSGGVERATLRLYAFNGTPDGPTVAPTDSGWDESTVTWEGRPPTGSVIHDHGAITPDTWIELDVTPAVTGDGVVSLLLAPTSADSARFWSREVGALGPQLVVTTSGGSPDTTPPETTIEGGPSGTVSDTSTTFTFDADEPGSTFTCVLDDAAPQACTSPVSYEGLAEGAHSFEVAATDPAGNTDPTPATRTWTIDIAASPDTYEFVTTADARVEERRPDHNFGADRQLIADGGSGRHVETYLRFDVEGLPATATVRSARLRLLITNGSWNGPTVQAADNAWDEASITWNTRPAAVGPVLDDLGGVSAGTWAEWDVTAAVTGDGSYTLQLATTSTDAIKADSLEAGGPVPTLVVTVDPSG